MLKELWREVKEQHHAAVVVLLCRGLRGGEWQEVENQVLRLASAAEL